MKNLKFYQIKFQK